MTQFRTIEIDFDVHKLIEAERKSFSEPPNDALRRLLNLPVRSTSPEPKSDVNGHDAWLGENVTLPHGTELRMRYNGRQYNGVILNGKWVVEKKTFDSPSGAASGVAVTKGGRKTRLDGWNYWDVKLPHESSWKRISDLRTPPVTAEELGL